MVTAAWNSFHSVQNPAYRPTAPPFFLNSFVDSFQQLVVWVVSSSQDFQAREKGLTWAKGGRCSFFSLATPTQGVDSKVLV